MANNYFYSRARMTNTRSADAIVNEGLHSAGTFSVCSVAGAIETEDSYNLNSGSFGTFVGVQDGHGGTAAARIVSDRIFERFQEIVAEHYGSVTGHVFTDLFLKLDEDLMRFVDLLWHEYPAAATVGTCCLVGFISQQTIFVANAGDSRAVLGRKDGNTGHIIPLQLSVDHKAGLPENRDMLHRLHPEDPEIVTSDNGTWKVKGIIPICRSIGDAYLKNSAYNTTSIDLKYRLRGPISMPYLTAEPAISMHHLGREDSFVIFASGGLWDLLSNEEAVEIVHKHPHSGSAKQLIDRALQKAARAPNLSYEGLCEIGNRERCNYKDDITVIILFFNHELIAMHSTVSVQSRGTKYE